jgi:hypothetical protein
MKVTEYRDGESVQTFGPATQPDIAPDNSGKVRRQKYAVTGNRRKSGYAGDCRGAKKLASRLEKG